MRDGSPDAQAALSRQGRYQSVRDNLRVKEVHIGEGDAAKRFIICHNPAEAERQRAPRAPAKSASSAQPPRSPTPSTTPPEFACATSRSRSRSSSLACRLSADLRAVQHRQTRQRPS
jgi:hypothetical protein